MLYLMAQRKDDLEYNTHSEYPPTYTDSNDRIRLVTQVDANLGNVRSYTQLPPLYSACWSQDHVAVTERALQDVASRKSPDDSPFYVPRRHSLDSDPESLFEQPAGFPYQMLGLGSALPEHALLLQAFFAAISDGREAYVSRLLASDLVEVESLSWLESGLPERKFRMTPLLAAVRAKHRHIVTLLIENGARVDGWGLIANHPSEARYSWYNKNCTLHDFFTARTPLQLAASQGDLPMVKLLLEQYGADDSLVAPDGQMALRLAVAGEHKHVVAYLPSRVGGAKTRLKHRWRLSSSKIQRVVKRTLSFAEVLVWDCPKLIFWHFPKWLVKECFWIPIKDFVVWCWKNKKHFGPWCVNFAKKLPGEIKDFAIWAGNHVKKIPGYLKRICKEIYHDIKKLIQRIPEACRIIGRHLRDGFKSFYHSLAQVISRSFAFIHSVLVAIAGFFRNLTLKDLWNGFVDVLRAIFISFPKMLMKLFKKSWEVVGMVLEQLFGILGCLFWALVRGLWEVLIFIPHQIWKILHALGEFMGELWQEIMTWWNPKA